MSRIVISFFLLFSFIGVIGQEVNHSVARKWNEALLNAVRNDFARPTVHARNLFHTSIALYDSWAIYDEVSTPFLLGNSVQGFRCPCEDLPDPEDVESAREEAMSYASYRLLMHRFRRAPGRNSSLPVFDRLMDELGYDINFTSQDYQSGSAAALGNYLAQCLIDFGNQDGSNEQNDYENREYEPENDPMQPNVPGTQDIIDPNRWQPLSFITFEDQAGFEISDRSPDFLSPEWGRVVPFALRSFDRVSYFRDGYEYWVYHDPGEPALTQQNGGNTTSEYQWGHSLVSIWSSHLDPGDGVLWDISPGTIGNSDGYPTTIEGLRDFYNEFEGGDSGRGHSTNPKTGEPYEPQFVPRGDYTRVLAEFWADGPDSETPPGHWFSILNVVNDHPELEKRYKGEGDILSDLEWDVKSYFVLGGAVHDAAISAWSIKGWYDYIRPISAIRYMAERGQSSNPNANNYAADGIPLVPGFVEEVRIGDPLAGEGNENLGKIKVYAWRGPDFIDDPDEDVAGVDWILAENWWPYQRPTFVTPPFAGYVSGHSTFSRAAAEVLTFFTGDPFFPGGIGEFIAKKDEFLVFEKGPSQDIILQWATYRDASDQTSLSRIWGGIHPPVDDVPGRLIGIEIANDAFALADRYFTGEVITSTQDPNEFAGITLYPNPVVGKQVTVQFTRPPLGEFTIRITSMTGKIILEKRANTTDGIGFSTVGMKEGVYILQVISSGQQWTKRFVIEK